MNAEKGQSKNGVTVKFDPDQVKKVELGFDVNEDHLKSIELFDKQNKSLGLAGNSQRAFKFSITLHEGERIVGLSSFTEFSNKTHYDIQFIIAKI